VHFITKEDIFKHENQLRRLKSEISDELTKMNKEIDENKELVFEEMEQKTNYAFSQIKKQILDSLGGKPVDANEMAQLLSVKADKAEINILDKLKADKETTDRFEAIAQF
jgi:hypothetical protein